MSPATTNSRECIEIGEVDRDGCRFAGLENQLSWCARRQGERDVDREGSLCAKKERAAYERRDYSDPTAWLPHVSLPDLGSRLEQHSALRFDSVATPTSSLLRSHTVVQNVRDGFAQPDKNISSSFLRRQESILIFLFFQ